MAQQLKCPACLRIHLRVRIRNGPDCLSVCFVCLSIFPYIRRNPRSSDEVIVQDGGVDETNNDQPWKLSYLGTGMDSLPVYLDDVCRFRFWRYVEKAACTAQFRLINILGRFPLGLRKKEKEKNNNKNKKEEGKKKKEYSGIGHLIICNLQVSSTLG